MGGIIGDSEVLVGAFAWIQDFASGSDEGTIGVNALFPETGE